MIDYEKAKLACEMLLRAYAKGAERGSVDWSEIDDAHQAARAALLANRRITRVLDVSTAHLTMEERGLLEENALPGQTHLGQWGGVVATQPFDVTLNTDLPDGASTTLVLVMREALRLGCEWVMFDADGSDLDGFETFPDIEEDA